MHRTIYLEPPQVPAALKSGYTGKTFKAIVGVDVFIPADAGTWSGGSRDVYHALEINTGRQVSVTDTFSAPWDDSRKDKRIDLRPGFAIVRHTIFCGKDLGLTFFVHPDNAAQLLPEPSPELSDYARIVLNATARFKSSYNGMDRYDMAQRDADKSKPFPTREQWNAAKADLIAGGFLTKAGAITPKGRNAR